MSSKNMEELREQRLLLSVPETARLLGLGSTFTWGMVRRGELGPVVKIGRRVLLPRSALEDLIARQTSSK